jgi:hypothetical protein
MNNYQTIEKLKTLHLVGMMNTHQQQVQDNLYSDYTLDQYLGLLADEETDLRQSRKVKRLLKQANFSDLSAMENIDYLTLYISPNLCHPVRSSYAIFEGA